MLAMEQLEIDLEKKGWRVSFYHLTAALLIATLTYKILPIFTEIGKLKYVFIGILLISIFVFNSMSTFLILRRFGKKNSSNRSLILSFIFIFSLSSLIFLKMQVYLIFSFLLPCFLLCSLFASAIFLVIEISRTFGLLK